jgi:hypothetical protein
MTFATGAQPAISGYLDGRSFGPEFVIRGGTIITRQLTSFSTRVVVLPTIKS